MDLSDSPNVKMMGEHMEEGDALSITGEWKAYVPKCQPHMQKRSVDRNFGWNNWIEDGLGH